MTHRRPKRRWTPDERVALLAHWRGGVAPSELAAHYGISAERIRTAIAASLSTEHSANAYARRVLSAIRDSLS